MMVFQFTLDLKKNTYLDWWWSQVHVVDNPDQPIMVPAVLERIVSHEGWICRSVEQVLKL
ncbi:MAG: hypothetical protein CM1200mP30_24240 [Pseudomonadota bacterium]|nr:MAG: hypothetical protein CM1200mP30_24240 [Pseudomonadota bacterium]